MKLIFLASGRNDQHCSLHEYEVFYSILDIFQPKIRWKRKKFAFPPFIISGTSENPAIGHSRQAGTGTFGVIHSRGSLP